MSRIPIIAGNWKMNKTVPQALEFVRELRPLVAGLSGVEAIICPPFTALHPLREEIAGTDTEVALGAQDVFWKTKGAYTSQISPIMLVDLGVEFVIIGHSEPRGRFGVPETGATEQYYKFFGENNHTVNLKIQAAIEAELSPILCVGETLDERKANETDSVIQYQMREALNGVSERDAATKLVVAYEPVWAIGTGETCDSAEANRVCGMIRMKIESLYSPSTAESVRIQYGGSMKPSNAKELLSQTHIDGGLIGGASLVASDFAEIIKIAGG